MPVRKKYRFIHLVIAVCSHKYSHPQPSPFRPPPSFFLKQWSPPLTASLPSSSHPSYPQTISSTLSLLRFLLRSLCISDETGSAREGGKKKNKNSFCVGQVVPASRKCFSVPPSHSGAWPRAKDGVWVSSPQKEKSAGTEVSGPHHTGTRRKPLPKL